MKIIVLMFMFVINTIFPIIMELTKNKKDRFKSEYDIRDVISLNTYMVCLNITVMGFLYFG